MIDIHTIMMEKNIAVVVAICHNNGIGLEGDLPWPRLKGDMAYFKQLTMFTSDVQKSNVVIMGRKTWDSIPAARRPLPGRINIVLSTNPDYGKTLPLGVYHATSFVGAMQLIDSEPMNSRIESIFVIGGEAVYQSALKSPRCNKIYMTCVMAPFECDAFFPLMPPRFVLHSSSDHMEDAGIRYTMDTYVLRSYD